MEPHFQAEKPASEVIPMPEKGQFNVLNWEELRSRSLQPGGFGLEREAIWPKLLNAKIPPPTSVTVLEGNDEDDKENLRDYRVTIPTDTNPVVEHRDENQIRLDTDRSFVLYPQESQTHTPKAALKSDLNRLIVSVFRNHPKLSYFQGYHDIMTVIYLTLPTELQFSCAEKLSLHRLRDSMLHSLEPVLGLLRVLKNLLRLADPDYAELLERDSPLPFYALSNLLTLFSHDMTTLPLIQHVFDYLFCRPPIAVVYLAAAVLLVKKDYIQSLDGQLEPFMLHPILSALPPLTEGLELMEEESKSTDKRAPQHTKDEISSPEAVIIKHEANVPELRQSGSDTHTLQSSCSTNTSPNTPDVGNPIPKPTMPTMPINLALDQALPDDPPPADRINEDNEQSTKLTTEPIISPEPSLPHLDPPPLDNHPFSRQPPSQRPGTEPVSSSLSSSLDLGESPLPPIKSVTLPSILSLSDSLYARHPPSNPSLKLSSIMGPQSVLFTWSENPAELPSDATAEAMVSRPELVVYPFIPEEMLEDGAEENSDSESCSEDEKQAPTGGARSRKFREKGGMRNKGGKPRRRRSKIVKKMQKLFRVLNGRAAGRGMTQVDGRTMVAGAVLVLGVAMAIYGVKS